MRRNWSGRDWENIKKGLNIIKEDWSSNGEEVNDIAFTFSGIAPLSIRLIEKDFYFPELQNETGSQLKKSLENFGGGGTTTTTAQTEDEGFFEFKEKLKGGNGKSGVIVCFLGGVTYVEVNALRWLSEKWKKNFLIMTTDVVTGDALLSEVTYSMKL